MSEDPQRPTIGRCVWYVLPAGRNAGKFRKADVVDVIHSPEGDLVACELTVALASTDLGRSRDSDPPLDAVLRDAGGFALFMRVIAKAGGPDHPGTWFWPPRV